MKGPCIYDEVCKHKRGEEGEDCAISSLCKFYDDPAIGGGSTDKPKRSYKKRVKVKDETDSPDDDTSDDIGETKITEKAFKKARAKLDRMQRAGKLDENQARALESYKGKHFSTLEEPQKQQIVNMAKGK